MRAISLIILFVLLSSTIIQAQEYPYTPFSTIHQIHDSPPLYKLQVKTNTEVLQEHINIINNSIDNIKSLSTDTAEKYKSLYKEKSTSFSGILRPIHKGLFSIGKIDTLPDGSIICRVTFISKNAASLSLMYSNFSLQKGERIFVYNEYKSMIRGAFTYMNISKSKKFTHPSIDGESITLEYNAENWVKNPTNITIDWLEHSFENNQTILNRTKAHDGCQFDVMCKEFYPWCNQIRSEVSLTFPIIHNESTGATFWCGGVLLNNEKVDFTPYILTAQHCLEHPPTGSGNPDLDNILDADLDRSRIIYNYQFNKCDDFLTNETDLELNSTVGMKLHTMSGFAGFYGQGHDMALLESTQHLPYQYNVYLAGWNIYGLPSTNVYGIHNAHSVPKKFVDGELHHTIFSFLYNVYWTPGHGFTASGSSGSPLFDSEKRVIGVCSGGGDEGCEKPHEYYGKFKKFSWAHSIIAPSGSTAMDGVDPILACIPYIELDGSFNNPADWNENQPQIKIQAGNKIEIGLNEKTEFRSGSNYIIQAGDEIIINPNGNPDWHDHNRSLDGAFVEFTIAPCIKTEDDCGFNNAPPSSRMANPNTIASSSGSFIYPNPSNDAVYINPSYESYNYIVIDNIGNTVYKDDNVYSFQQSLNISTFTNGVYYIHIRDINTGETKVEKLIKY